uniref:Plasmodium yoelii subtelomeric region (PYST-C1) n=1 Tax=Strongyloides papillosus TaxID=174720 RepID=A0A0N5B6R5_STREA
MQIIIFCVLSIIVPIPLSSSGETKNMSEIISSHHNSNSVPHIHESVDTDEGKGFRIGTEFFIDNNLKRGRRNNEKESVEKNGTNEILNDAEGVIEKSKDENNSKNTKVNKVINDIKNNMDFSNCGRKNITYYFLITILLLLKIVY